MPSRAETTRDQWATALALITTDNGYRNTVKAVSKAFPSKEDQLTQFPHIAIELGDSDVRFREGARTINDEVISLHIAGYVKADTETKHIASAVNMMDKVEAMACDLKKKICTDLLNVNVAHATNPWIVLTKETPPLFSRMNMLHFGLNIGMVTAQIKISLKNQTASFA